MKKIKNQMSAFNTPIASGNFKGVNWRSLTSKEELRAPEIKEMWDSAKAWSKLLNSNCPSHAETVQMLTGMTIYEYIQQPVDRLKLYMSRARYGNNFKVI